MKKQPTTQKATEKRNTKPKKSSKSIDEDGVLSIWTIDDEFSPERLGIKPKYKYSRDKLYSHLMHERIVNSVQKKILYQQEQEISNRGRWVTGLIIANVLALAFVFAMAIGS